MEAKVVYDRDSGRSRGFGFVTYSSPEEVNSAISSLDGVVSLSDQWCHDFCVFWGAMLVYKFMNTSMRPRIIYLVILLMEEILVYCLYLEYISLFF